MYVYTCMYMFWNTKSEYPILSESKKTSRQKTLVYIRDIYVYMYIYVCVLYAWVCDAYMNVSV